MVPIHVPRLNLPSFPSISFLDSTESSDILLRLRRPSCHPIAISSSSFDNHKDRNRVRVKEVDTKLRSDVINLEDDEDSILIGQIVAKVSAPTYLSFFWPTLVLRDEDLKDKEFQLEKHRQHGFESHEVIREDDLNIDWIDDNEEVEVKEDGDGVVGP